MKKNLMMAWGMGVVALMLLLPACDDHECSACSDSAPCVLPDSGPIKDTDVPDTVVPDAMKPDAGQLQGWAISGGGDGLDHSHAITLDQSGNLVLVGKVNKGTAAGKFGSFTITGAGGDDALIARVTSGGQVTDVTTLGTKDNEVFSTVAMDASKNLVIGGFLTGTAAFGSTKITSNGFSDFLVTRLNSSGKYDWAISGGSKTNSDYAKDLAVDASGNVYLGATFADTMTFNGKTYTNVQGQKRAMLVKLDSTGKVVWVTDFSGSKLHSVGGVALDSSGNIYMSGSFKGTLGYGTKTLTATGRDTFLAKYDSKGAVTWVAQATGSGESHATSLALDAKGNPVIAGYFDGASATFGSKTLPTTGSNKKNDAFVAGLTSAGAFSWALSAGGSDADAVRGMFIDTKGTIYVVGGYKGAASFGSLSLTGVSTTGTDAFVASINSTGAFQKVTSAGGAAGSVEATGIAVDSSGETYITGVFKGTASFAGHKLTAAGTTHDIFVWKTPTL